MSVNNIEQTPVIALEVEGRHTSQGHWAQAKKDLQQPARRKLRRRSSLRRPSNPHASSPPPPFPAATSPPLSPGTTRRPSLPAPVMTTATSTIAATTRNEIPLGAKVPAGGPSPHSPLIPSFPSFRRPSMLTPPGTPRSPRGPGPGRDFASSAGRTNAAGGETNKPGRSAHNAGVASTFGSTASSVSTGTSGSSTPRQVNKAFTDPLSASISSTSRTAESSPAACPMEPAVTLSETDASASNSAAVRTSPVLGTPNPKAESVTPRRQRPQKLVLKSSSGLTGHLLAIHSTVLSRYTDYGSDGSPSPKVPTFRPVIWEDVKSTGSHSLGSGGLDPTAIDHQSATSVSNRQVSAATDAGSGASRGSTESSSASSNGGVSAMTRSSSWTGSLPESDSRSFSGTPPLPDFFGGDLFDRALSHPTLSKRLRHYAHQLARASGGKTSHGAGIGASGAEAMDFLHCVREYEAALETLITRLSVISTRFTSLSAAGTHWRAQAHSTTAANGILPPLPSPSAVPAAQPYQAVTASPLLPPNLSRALNADLTKITASVLPGLEALFMEPSRVVAATVKEEIWEGFVHHRLAELTSRELAQGPADHFQESVPSRARFPGLGSAFVLADPASADSAVRFASDSWLRVAGVSCDLDSPSRYRVFGRNARWLQGPLTDLRAVRKLRDALVDTGGALGGTTQLVVNYRHGSGPGREFWNLLFVIPLRDQAGRVRWLLGGMVNVSDALLQTKSQQAEDGVDALGRVSAKADTEAMLKLLDHGRMAHTLDEEQRYGEDENCCANINIRRPGSNDGVTRAIPRAADDLRTICQTRLELPRRNSGDVIVGRHQRSKSRGTVGGFVAKHFQRGMASASHADSSDSSVRFGFSPQQRARSDLSLLSPDTPPTTSSSSHTVSADTGGGPGDERCGHEQGHWKQSTAPQSDIPRAVATYERFLVLQVHDTVSNPMAARHSVAAPSAGMIASTGTNIAPFPPSVNPAEARRGSTPGDSSRTFGDSPTGTPAPLFPSIEASAKVPSAGPRMLVAFASPGALQFLSAGRVSPDSAVSPSGTHGDDTDMLLSLYLYRDVFAVLAERCAAHVGSGRDKDMGCYRGLMPQSITKTFKAAVRDKIRRGEGVSLDMVVPTFPRNDVSSYAATVQSATSSGRSTIGQPKTRPRTSSSASDTEIPSSRGTEKKAVAISSAEYGKADTGPRKIIGATATAGGPRVERIMTHWSPLRDVHGKVGWCVLVLAGSS